MKLSELFNPNEFAARHLSFGDEAALLAAVGEKSMDDFVGNTLPQSIRMPSELDLPEALTEADALAKLKGIASKNVINKSYIGLGYYPTRVPNVILRNVLENPGWYTAYTPYQAEIAQGRLEALLNFQQVCIDLTGFPVAGASLLDEATAAAEAMAMAHRVGKVKSERFFVDARVYPQTLDVMKTRAKYFGFELVVSDFAQADEGEYFGALFQYVGKDGDVQDLQDVIGSLKAKGTIVAVAADIMSLVLLKSPAELGADIALGNTQRFGVPMGFGGPHAAYFAFKDEFKRSAPETHHRRIQRRIGQTCLAHGFVHPRTTHPPRKSDIQYLYRTGIAGELGGHVRRLSRYQRRETHRQPHSHTGFRLCRRAGFRRYQSGSRSLLRYRYRRFRQQRESRPSVCRCFGVGLQPAPRQQYSSCGCIP